MCLNYSLRKLNLFGQDGQKKSRQFLKENPVYVFTSTLFMVLIPINDIYAPKLYANIFKSTQSDKFKVNQFHTSSFATYRR